MGRIIIITIILSLSIQGINKRIFFVSIFNVVNKKNMLKHNIKFGNMHNKKKRGNKRE